ncbi:MAG: response regulator transcription factor, partial [Desulfobacterales bacterium]|nr:response regulator transcription factor [Desulfobacterales bacterium]
MKILLADDHELILEGLRTILAKNADWEVVGSVCDGRSAVKLAAKTQPDIAVLDISMPELNGIETTRQILRESPST